MLKIAGILVMFDAAIFFSGVLVQIPPEQTEVIKAAAVMKATIVPMPIGAPKTYADIFLGTNIIVALFLLLNGVTLVLKPSRKAALITALGLIVFGVVAYYKFLIITAVIAMVSGLLTLFETRSSTRKTEGC